MPLLPQPIYCRFVVYYITVNTCLQSALHQLVAVMSCQKHMEPIWTANARVLHTTSLTVHNQNWVTTAARQSYLHMRDKGL